MIEKNIKFFTDKIGRGTEVEAWLLGRSIFGRTSWQQGLLVVTGSGRQILTSRDTRSAHAVATPKL